MPRRKLSTEVIKEIQQDAVDAEIKELTPYEYFVDIKGRIKDTNSKELNALYENAAQILNRLTITKQKAAAKKVVMYIDSLEKEMKIIESGFKKYVLRNDVELYIDKVASQKVKIIELENYERVIPDDVIDKIASIPEGLFEKMYVIFSDLTGTETKKAKASKKDKDPILLGCNLLDGYVCDRMYYIADWVDEYCDLTFDKMLQEYKVSEKKDMDHEIIIPKTVEDLKEVVSKMK